MESQENTTRCYDSIAWLSVDALSLPRNLLDFFKKEVTPNATLQVFRSTEQHMETARHFADYLEPFLFFASATDKGLAVLYQENPSSQKRDLALAEIIKLQTNWDILYITDSHVSDLNIDYTVSKEGIKKFIKDICSNKETQSK